MAAVNGSSGGGYVLSREGIQTPEKRPRDHQNPDDAISSIAARRIETPRIETPNKRGKPAVSVVKPNIPIADGSTLVREGAPPASSSSSSAASSSSSSAAAASSSSSAAASSSSSSAAVPKTPLLDVPISPILKFLRPADCKSLVETGSKVRDKIVKAKFFRVQYSTIPLLKKICCCFEKNPSPSNALLQAIATARGLITRFEEAWGAICRKEGHEGLKSLGAITEFVHNIHNDLAQKLSKCSLSEIEKLKSEVPGFDERSPIFIRAQLFRDEKDADGIEDKRGQGNAYQNIALQYLKLGDLKKATAIAKQIKHKQLRSQVFSRIVFKHSERRQYELALKAVEEIGLGHVGKERSLGLRKIAEAYMWEGKFAEASEVISTMPHLTTKDECTFYLLIILLYNNKINESIEEAKRLSNPDKRNGGFFRIALKYVEKGKWEPALDVAEKIDREEYKQRIHVDVLNGLITERKLERAEALASSLPASPRFDRAFIKLADELVGARKILSAQKYVKKITNPILRDSMLRTLRDALIEAGLFDDAVSCAMEFSATVRDGELKKMADAAISENKLFSAKHCVSKMTESPDRDALAKRLSDIFLDAEDFNYAEECVMLMSESSDRDMQLLKVIGISLGLRQESAIRHI